MIKRLCGYNFCSNATVNQMGNTQTIKKVSLNLSPL